MARPISDSWAPHSWEELPRQWLESRAGFFLSDTYVRRWTESMGSGELQAHMVPGADGSPLAVFPLLADQERIGLRQRRIWRSIGWNAAWYPHSFVPPDRPTAQAFAAFLCATRKEWDAVVASGPPDLLQDLRAAVEGAGMRVTAYQEQVLPHVSTDGGWQSYWEGRSSNLRKNLRSLGNRATRRGLRHCELAHPDEVDALLGRFFELHVARWAAKGQASRYTEGSRRRQFVTALAHDLAAQERLRLPYLEIEGRIAAMALCFVEPAGSSDPDHTVAAGAGSAGTRLDYWMPTFDVTMSDLSPGKLLLHHVVRSAFESGVEEIDLGPGNDTYKSWWATGTRRHAQAIVFQGDLRIWAAYHAKPQARRVAARLVRSIFGHDALQRHLPGRVRAFVSRSPR